MQIGFAIVSHSDKPQIHRLIGTLNKLYGDPPIAVHHDFHQSRLDTTLLPSNVRLVANPSRTGWGRLGVIQGAIKAMALLYPDNEPDSGPDYFNVLSTQDYPIAPAEKLISHVQAHAYDAWIDYRIVGQSTEQAVTQFGPGNNRLLHFEAKGNRDMLVERYLAVQFMLPILRRKPSGGVRLGRVTHYMPFRSVLSPFSDARPCFVGDQWFTGSKKAARRLLQRDAFAAHLNRYLHLRAVADECYYQSILLNSPELRICRHSMRFAEWNGGGAHPQLLTMKELPAMLESGSFFARKFAQDDPVLDAIDRELGLA